MIDFFKNTLNGWLYYFLATLSVINICAIIGFILERLQLEKDEKDKLAYVNDTIINTTDNASLAVDEIVGNNTNEINNNINVQTENKYDISNNINIDQSDDNNEINEIVSEEKEEIKKDDIIVFTDPDKNN